jgi:hypothetical protein
VLGGGLVLSLGIHLGLPFVNWHRVEAVSETPVSVSLMPPPPLPLPEADEPKISPDEDDSDAPKVPDKPIAKQAKTEPTPAPEEAKPEAKPEEKAAPPSVKLDSMTEKLALQQKQREERIAAMQARRAAAIAAREAKRAQQGTDGSGGVKGGAPDTGEWKTGKPDAVYMCNADDKGEELHVTRARPMSEWIAIVPTVLAGFDTRPDLGGYLNRMQQISIRDRNQLPKRIGWVELALPNDVLQLPLEEPHGVKIAVGRLDAKCLVGFKYAGTLFPFTIQRAPVRIIDAMNNTVNALVDVTFYKDVSMEITSVDGTPLPFKRARLKNGNAIQKNIEDHYEAARLAKSIADLFGINLGPKKPPPKAPPAKAPPPKATIAEGKPAKRQPD